MCGIAAWMGEHPYYNLYQLLLEQQHRGHDAAGIAIRYRSDLRVFGGGGYVWKALPEPGSIGLESRLGIGHVRYSTSGGYDEIYQPVLSNNKTIALAFNGNIYNYVEASKEILGDRKSYDWDAAALADLIEHYYGETHSLIEAVRETAKLVKGAYSLVAISSKGELVAARDPHGIRPLAVSINDEVVAVASETAALGALGLDWAELPRSRALYCQGSPRNCYTDSIAPAKPPRPCVFEYIYFLRPDSVFEGVVAHEARKRMGMLLARIDDVVVDIVVPVPDSGRSAAIGYAIEKGVPLDEGLYRNRFVGRAFISSPSTRKRRLLRKFSPIPSTIRGKSVAIVDDSIVRGDTSRLITRLARISGAREVHFRSASPPLRYPCFFGIDIPSRDELIASKHSVEEIRRIIGADTLLYNTVENLVRAIGKPVCLGCFTSGYPYLLHLQLLEQRFVSGRR